MEYTAIIFDEGADKKTLATQMRLYLLAHPNELQDVLEAFYDKVETLKLEGSQLRQTLIRRDEVSEL